MKFSELSEKPIPDLLKELESLSKAHFNLRMQFGTQQLSNTAQLKSTRRDIARVKTLLRRHELTDNKKAK